MLRGPRPIREGTISGFEKASDRLQVAGERDLGELQHATSHELTFIDNGATINLGFIPALSWSSNVQFGLTSGGNSTTSYLLGSLGPVHPG